MAEKGKITIGVPVYNGGLFFEKMLQSLAIQTYSNFQVVIMDNASDETTKSIATSMCEKDNRFRYYRNDRNIGAAPNFNRVFELEHSTEFYKWAAHDDYYHPRFLELCVGVLARSSDVVLAYSVPVLVDQTCEGSIVEEMGLSAVVEDFFVDKQARQNWIIGPMNICCDEDPVSRFKDVVVHVISSFELYGVMRSCVLEQCYFHDSYYGADKALLARLALRGRFEQVPEVLYVNNYHHLASRAMSKSQRRIWIDANGGGRWATTRLHWDLLRAPHAAKLSVIDQFECGMYTFRHFCNLRITDVARVWNRIRRRGRRAVGQIEREEVPSAPKSDRSSSAAQCDTSGRTRLLAGAHRQTDEIP